jgi:hypothetical protein
MSFFASGEAEIHSPPDSTQSTPLAPPKSYDRAAEEALPAPAKRQGRVYRLQPAVKQRAAASASARGRPRARSRETGRRAASESEEPPSGRISTVSAQNFDE